ncbi:hypothetical protein SFUMM280S_08953 [Streptomyces fumanus]
MGPGRPAGEVIKDWWRNSRLASKLAKSCNSFAPGTRVVMADGSTKAIEDVDIGDKVRATETAPPSRR